MNTKNMTAKQVMKIRNNHRVVRDYYVSTMTVRNGYFSLYLNKETGDMFDSYTASQSTRLKGGDIVLICSTPALNGASLKSAGMKKNQIATFETWCDEWFNEWLKEFFEPTLADAIRHI